MGDASLIGVSTLPYPCPNPNLTLSYPLLKGLPSELFGSVLAMGDASLIGVSSRNQGPLPQTAQVAAQQGTFLARLFNRRYRCALPQVLLL